MLNYVFPPPIAQSIVYRNADLAVRGLSPTDSDIFYVAIATQRCIFKYNSNL